MNKLLAIAAVAAIAHGVGTGAATAKSSQPPKVDLCHFQGHQAEHVAIGLRDYPTTHEGPSAVSFCEANGGNVITVACPSLKGHLKVPDEVIDRYCESLS